MPLKYIYILAFPAVILSCNRNSGLSEYSGLWYHNYIIKDGIAPEKFREKKALEIKEDGSIYMFNLYELSANGAMPKTLKGHSKPNKNGHTFTFERNNYQATFFEDSMTLDHEDLDATLFSFIRIPERDKKNIPALVRLSGPYKIKSEYYPATFVEFIDDSVLLHTGEYNAKKPAFKYKLVNMGEHQALVVNDYDFPYLINQSTEEGVSVFWFPYKNNYFFRFFLKLNPSLSKRKSLESGRWPQKRAAPIDILIVRDGLDAGRRKRVSKLFPTLKKEVIWKLRLIPLV